MSWTRVRSMWPFECNVMREQSLFPVAAATLTAVALVAMILIGSAAEAAEDKPKPAARPPQVANSDKSAKSTDTLPGIVLDQKHKVVLDDTDRIAALESIQFALTEVGDGASYIWHRNNGRLSGLVKPTSSFRAGSGEVCRHVMVMLTSGTRSRQTEGVACRLPSGQWRLEG